MPYNLPATSTSPAFFIYLINISASMRGALDDSPKIEHVN
jgi:hypothetical protein